MIVEKKKKKKNMYQAQVFLEINNVIIVSSWDSGTGIRDAVGMREFGIPNRLPALDTFKKNSPSFISPLSRKKFRCENSSKSFL